MNSNKITSIMIRSDRESAEWVRECGRAARVWAGCPGRWLRATCMAEAKAWAKDGIIVKEENMTACSALRKKIRKRIALLKN